MPHNKRAAWEECMPNTGPRAYSGALPVNITIRNVPDEVRDELAARAARSGRSLQDFLSAELVRIASTPSAPDAAGRTRLGASLNPALTADEIVAAVHEGRR
jgi:plasmid stability protein